MSGLSAETCTKVLNELVGEDRYDFQPSSRIEDFYEAWPHAIEVFVSRIRSGGGSSIPGRRGGENNFPLA